MTLKPVMALALMVSASACASGGQAPAGDRSQFDVVRDGINMDERALVCANDPQSVGFETSQACFADASARMQGDL